MSTLFSNLHCSCCGDPLLTAGCLRCTSSTTSCGHCGALLRCGCGRGSVKGHACPLVGVVSVATVIPPRQLPPPDDSWNDTQLMVNVW